VGTIIELNQSVKFYLIFIEKVLTPKKFFTKGKQVHKICKGYRVGTKEGVINLITI